MSVSAHNFLQRLLGNYLDTPQKMANALFSALTTLNSRFETLRLVLGKNILGYLSVQIFQKWRRFAFPHSTEDQNIFLSDEYLWNLFCHMYLFVKLFSILVKPHWTRPVWVHFLPLNCVDTITGVSKNVGLTQPWPTCGFSSLLVWPLVSARAEPKTKSCWNRSKHKNSTINRFWNVEKILQHNDKKHNSCGIFIEKIGMFRTLNALKVDGCFLNKQKLNLCSSSLWPATAYSQFIKLNWENT